MGTDAFLELLELQRADNLAQNPEKVNMSHFDIVLNMTNEILSEGECFSLKHLAINGSDLILAGFKAGKTIGEILDFLLSEVIEGRAENDKNTLLEIAKSKYGE